ncbi:hypothetical protein [uncultured Clostridium sp.]|uniref:hypothetical protein n=1 Tax=uncultured Clostridium sp. TaxID=59620 RepID=UPI0025D4F4B6|nr:hypothetical protein [uncultured Clostridium sp.]
MKKLIRSIVFMMTLMLFTPSVAKADSEISLNRVHSSADSVEVSIDGVRTIVNSFQVSLKLHGNVTLNDIIWSKELNKNAKTNFKYKSNYNVVDIYITSKENLVNKNGNIIIGTLKVDGPKKGSFNIIPNLEKDTGVLKLVSNTHKETIVSNISIVGEDNFVFPGDTALDSDKPDNNNPGETEKPSNSNKPGNNTSGEVSKPSDSNKIENSKSEEVKNPIASNKSEGNKGNSVIASSSNAKKNTATTISSDSRYKNEAFNVNSSNKNDTVLNDNNDFEDVENKVLSEGNEDYDNKIETKNELIKKDSKANKTVIYVGGAFVALLIGFVIYRKVR